MYSASPSRAMQEKEIVARLQEQMMAEREMVSLMNWEGLEAEVLRAVSTCETLAKVRLYELSTWSNFLHFPLPLRTSTLHPPPLPSLSIGECTILVRQ
jgi:hypothetical protein